MFKRTLTLAIIMALGTIGFAQSGAQTTGAQTPPAKPEPAKSKTLTAVQGTWVFTSVNGQDAAGQPEIVITITDDKYVQTIDGNTVEKGTLKFDDTKKPLHMDLVIIEGQDAGKTQLGVIELTSQRRSAPSSIRPARRRVRRTSHRRRAKATLCLQR
jgi:uncharacterized protein (TIGR03067 family)